VTSSGSYRDVTPPAGHGLDLAGAHAQDFAGGPDDFRHAVGDNRMPFSLETVPRGCSRDRRHSPRAAEITVAAGLADVRTGRIDARTGNVAVIGAPGDGEAIATHIPHGRETAQENFFRLGGGGDAESAQVGVRDLADRPEIEHGMPVGVDQPQETIDNEKMSERIQTVTTFIAALLL